MKSRVLNKIVEMRRVVSSICVSKGRFAIKIDFGASILWFKIGTNDLNGIETVTVVKLSYKI